MEKRCRKQLSIGCCDIVVAVAGNPNVGKSTLFNTITGEVAHVANWPGVTVSRTEGKVEYKGLTICFVDLPGTYGISATSPEEKVARDYILSGEPDLILVLADALAPERTLYLPLQILEITGRIVVALNKIDAAHARGIHIHVDGISKELGVPVIPISALTGRGIEELLEAIVDTWKKGGRKNIRIGYGMLEEYLEKLEERLRPIEEKEGLPARWLALHLLLDDPEIKTIVGKHDPSIIKEAEKYAEEFESRYGRSVDEEVAVARYSFIDRIVSRNIVRKELGEGELQGLDEVFLNPILGPLLSMVILLGVLFIAFTLNTGFPLNIILDWAGMHSAASFVEEHSFSSMLGELFSLLADWAHGALDPRVPAWLSGLIADGVIPGVGAVLSFLPLIMTAYAFLGALEDSGLATRIALSYNDLMGRFGYSGKALFPFILSLGCNVPGVLATRALEEREERIVTALTAPLIPCQARLVVIIAFASAFFASGLLQAVSVVSIYLISFLLALFLGIVFRRRLLGKREAPILAMEIPPLHSPSLRVIWWHTWDNSKHFIKKAATIILVLSVASWLLLSYGPGGAVDDPSKSYAAVLGRAISPLFKAYDIGGDTAWKVAFAFENGFIAKEGVLEAIVLMQGEADPTTALKSLGLSPVQAYSLLLAMTLYVPCMATIAAIWSETRSTKYALLAVAYMLLLAYVVSLLAYRLLSLL